MHDRDLNSADDYKRKSDEALEIASAYDRAERLGNLLESATNDRRRKRNGNDGFGAVIAILRARVSRSIDELDDLLTGPENPHRRKIDIQRLAARLKEIRSAKTDPHA